MTARRAEVEKIEVTNAATVYRIHVASFPRVGGGDPDRYLMLETGWAAGYGEWIHLDVEEIAWSYLEEKIKALGRYPGDKPGWIKALKAAGVKVFE